MKSFFIALTITFIALTFPSCAGKRDPNQILTYSKNVVGGWPKGRKLDSYDASRVRDGEHIHAYHVGRLPSKDRRSMSEAHTVYRKEHDASWDQRLPATPMASRGPVIGIKEPSHNPVPDSDVVKTELKRQRDLSTKLQVSQQRISGLEDSLETKIAQFESSSKIFTTVQNDLKKTTAEKKMLELKLKEAQLELKEARGELNSEKIRNEALREEAQEAREAKKKKDPFRDLGPFQFDTESDPQQ